MTAAVFVYVRVSHRDQAEHGESLSVQQSRAEAYATANGWTVSGVFVERGVSGSRPFPDRPESSKLMALLKPGDRIISPKLDRCFRNARDALNTVETLRTMNVSLYLLDIGGNVSGNGDNPIARVILTVLAALAEWEVSRTRERIRDVKASQREQQKYLGGKVPFGWRVKDGKLVANVREQNAIKQMRKLSKRMSLRAMVGEMEERGFSLTAEGIRKILLRHRL